MVLLLEPGSHGYNLREWLCEKGLIAWKANDVNHALEELSDFTVRRRPDVVMLEVPGLSHRFDALRDAIHQSSGNVCVYAYTPTASLSGGRFASSLDQLTSIIHSQTGPTNN